MGRGLAFTALLGLAVPVQTGNATQFATTEIETLATSSEEHNSSAEATWSELPDNEPLQCRSGLDGSNTSFVEQVRAQIANPANFAHIVTTFWPQQDGNYELTMMFWVNSNGAQAEVREARAAVDFRTCIASVHSIS